MMPLLFADIDEENVIKKIGGSCETKHHLENLGFVPGSSIRVVHKANGNVIVNIKNTRVAISKEIAKKIIV